MNVNERVLAYDLSRELTLEEMQQISGGLQSKVGTVGESDSDNTNGGLGGSGIPGL